MKTRFGRKSATALVTFGLAAGLLGVGWSGSAGAGAPQRIKTQTPPPPGSGVVVVVEEPQPIGPRSLT